MPRDLFVECVQPLKSHVTGLQYDPCLRILWEEKTNKQTATTKTSHRSGTYITAQISTIEEKVQKLYETVNSCSNITSPKLWYVWSKFFSHWTQPVGPLWSWLIIPQYHLYSFPIYSSAHLSTLSTATIFFSNFPFFLKPSRFFSDEKWGGKNSTGSRKSIGIHFVGTMMIQTLAFK